MLKIRLSQVLVATLLGFPVGILMQVSKAYSQSYFGAIAYSEITGGYGYSYDYANRAAAETAAVRACEANTGYGDCFALIWFQNACGALAQASNGAYGAAWDSYQAGAEYRAIDTCSSYGGYDCVVTRWVCTTR